MIFLAAGTQKFPMDRLFEQMDALAAAGKAEGGLFAQIGCARYEPAHYPYARFLSREALTHRWRRAICSSPTAAWRRSSPG